MAKAGKITVDHKKKVIALLRVGRSYAIAARKIGVSRKALWNLRQREPRFKARCEEARSYADDGVEGSFYDSCVGEPVFDPKSGEIVARKNQNPRACLHWLRNRRPEEWPDGRDIQIGGAGQGLAITIRLVRGVDDNGKLLEAGDGKTGATGRTGKGGGNSPPQSP